MLRNLVLFMCCAFSFITKAETAIQYSAEEKQWLGENHIVRVRVADYPPYQISNPQASGISVDYIKLIADRAGFKVQYISGEDIWAEVLNDITGNKDHYDMVLTMFRNPEREKQFAFTKDYISAPWVIFAKNDSPYYGSMEALHGKMVASEKSYAITKILKEKYPEINLKEVGTTRDAMFEVATGNADAYIGNLAVSSYIIRESRLSNLTVVASTPFGLHTQAMAIRSDWKVLAGLINKGLDSITPEERTAINNKWGVIEFKNTPDYTLAGQIAAAASLVIILFIYWNRRLRNEIALRIKSQNEVEFLAYNDSLTKLSNWTHAVEQLEKFLSDKSTLKGCIAIFIETRYLSEINRIHGNDMGDILIKNIASRIKSSASSASIIARISGGKFFVVASCCYDEEAIRTYCSTLIDCLNKPYKINQQTISADFSVGAASLYGSSDTITKEILIHRADLALDEAIRSGTNEYAVYSEKLQQAVNLHLQKIEEIKLGFERNEFILYYQPKIDLSTGKLLGFEALVRWLNPSKGIISPANFIPLAEECGLIVPLSRWILMEACRQISSWIENGLGEINIAVNISAAHFEAGTLLADVKQALLRNGVPARLLSLELTESVLTNEHTHAAESIKRLRALGIQFALDDFGTGYSSLSYLNKYEFDYIKIDQSFVRAVTSANKTSTTCEAIIVMAHFLGIKVIAEGIETAGQLAFLLKAGSEIGQGYLFCRPISTTEIDNLLHESHHKQIEMLWTEKYSNIVEQEAENIDSTPLEYNELHKLSEIKHAKILIIDDMRYNTILLDKILRHAGLKNIYIINDAREAEDAFIKLSPDLVILDIRMPHLDGFDVLNIIRSHDTGKHTPVVIMTAVLDLDLKHKALMEGVQDFIMKPFVPAEIITRLRNVILASYH